MSAYNKKLVAFVEQYKLEAGVTEVSSRQVARWLVAKGGWKQHPLEAEKQCARDISRALGEEYEIDPQGRRVRTHHVAIVERDGEQIPLWAAMATATREHMALGFQQRRQRIVGDCKQVKIDVDSYNESFNASGEPIQIILDFTDDVTEAYSKRRVHFRHLAAAARFAISARCARLRLLARALPPFDAPSLLRATAAGFLVSGRSSGSGEPSSLSPMACSTTRRATAVKSRPVAFGFSLLAREGMAHSGTNPNTPRSQ